MGLLNNQLKAYRALLSQEMKKAHWYQIPVWGPLMGFIGGLDNGIPRSVPHGAQRSRTLQPTFKPIEVLTDFEQYGWDMDIPVYYPFVKKPIYGDNQALGNEEKSTWAYQKAWVNQVRKPVLLKDGLMGEKALTKQLTMNMMKNTKAKLQDYNARWQTFAPYDALLRGYSANILAPATEGGFGASLSQKSHPNFYVAGSGQATWSDTPATYETNVATALATLNNVASDWMSTTVIQNMVMTAAEKKIMKVSFGSAGDYYVIILNHWQMLQLQRDQEWIDNQRAAAAKMGEMSPLFTGKLEGFYAGAAIVSDMNAPGARYSGMSGYSSARGTVNYGNDNPLESPLDTSPIKLAILVGASAVLCGHSVSLGFETEDWDYKNKKSEASFTVIGYNRADIIDNDAMFGTANYFKENTSSLVCATYSPSTLSW